MDKHKMICKKPSLKTRQHFGIRKFKLGVASVMLSASFLGADMALAQAVSEPSLAFTTVAEEVKDDLDDKASVASKAKDESVADTSLPEDVVAVTQKEEDSSQDSTSQSEANAQESSTEKQTIAPVMEKDGAVQETNPPIEEGHLRVHFKTLPSDNLESIGLWTWDDVETPSGNKGSWPNAATRFSTAMKDSYGYYLDVKLSSEKRHKVSLLINNTAGENITGDKTVELISSKMNEVWFDEKYMPHLYEPLKEGMIRINYYRTDNQYKQKSLWLWGDVEHPTQNWPDGIDFEKEGKYGRYIDVPLKEAAKTIGFLLLDESKSGDDVKIQDKDYHFTELKKQSQIFLKDADSTIYTNPYYVNDIRMTGAQHISLTEIEATFSTLENASKEELMKQIQIKNKDNETVQITDLVLDVAAKKVRIQADLGQEKAPYVVRYGNEQFQTRMNWQLKDALYRYDGELGARVSQEGKQVDVTLWSPSAEQVQLVVYDKDNPEQVVGKVAMTKGEKGTWTAQLTKESPLGIADYRGYYYHYEITRGDQSVLVLDPYAKSLAAWNSDEASKGAAYKVAKAAFVDPSQYGPKDLTYAEIPNFKTREDAIIYEAHVRDFTSDATISKDLKAQFGTFSAFIEKLDYLKELGVTHVQLLPVLSYYFVNELKNAERMDHYASSNSNYNWGYDPQNYFSLTGMYSSDPTNPTKRIEEFKQLVHEIHKRGMGVILDVVYNHTAQTSIFEDLEPNYYHFMDADGTPRTSFGGGRLGTTHHMSRRVLVDSIQYLVKEYKVDGFRFDMMGDHDAEAIQKAYDTAKALNPNLIMLGEGWVTYAGDENQPTQPADQSWMKHTDSVAVFSDDIRNTLKSGYPSEGQPSFITGGKKNIEQVFKNIKAQPTNFEADSPGDVIQYIAAHDNLTLFDIIAQSIKKDPAKAENNAEIHRRLRIGNLLILTSQGTPFIHSGQEYGRTKQFRDPAYKTPVSADKVPNKSHLLTNADGTPFEYPYFIHDSYDSTDVINHFDWSKATDASNYPEHTRSQAYMKGLIALRKSTDAFNLKTKAEIDKRVSLISIPEQNGVGKEDLVIGYQAVASNGDRYAVFINADNKERQFDFGATYQHLVKAEVLADGKQVGTSAITDPSGVTLSENGLRLAPLTATVLRLKEESEVLPEAPKEEAQVRVKVVDKTDNQPLKNREVDFLINGKATSAITDENGIAQITANIGETVRYRIAQVGLGYLNPGEASVLVEKDMKEQIVTVERAEITKADVLALFEKKKEALAQSNLTDEEKAVASATLKEIVDTFNQRLGEAETNEAVARIKENVVTALDEINTVSVIKEEAKRAIMEAAQNRKESFAANADLSQEDKKAAEKLVDAELERALLEVEKARTNQDVETKKVVGIETIQKVNPKQSPTDAFMKWFAKEIGDQDGDGDVDKEDVKAWLKGDKGDKGDPGTPGEKGDKGDKGDPGTPGEKGDKGDKGDSGTPGEKGDKGDKGDPGTSGEKGDKGDKGDPGTPGDKGDKGDPGTPGEKGDKGDKGDPGTPGAKGDKGDKGNPGTPGDKGDKGDKGDPGTPGDKGDKGDKGNPGTPGEKGDKGDKGDPGTPGDKGDKGDPGTPGDKGDKGDKGNPGTPGEKGDKGDKGDPGTPGEKGDKGDKGDPGTPGDKGDKGDPGTPGEKGDKGDKGDPGTPGAKGDKGDKGNPGTPGDKGDKGDKGDPGTPGDKGDKGDKGNPGTPGEKGDKGDKGDPGTPGEKDDKGEKGDPGTPGAKGDKGDKGDPGAKGGITTPTPKENPKLKGSVLPKMEENRIQKSTKNRKNEAVSQADTQMNSQRNPQKKGKFALANDTLPKTNEQMKSGALLLGISGLITSYGLLSRKKKEKDGSFY